MKLISNGQAVYNIENLFSIYRTYKLTHQQSHAQAFDEQIDVLRAFCNDHEECIIVGDMNLDYNKRNTASYHHRRLYDAWIAFEVYGFCITFILH